MTQATPDYGLPTMVDGVENTNASSGEASRPEHHMDDLTTEGNALFEKMQHNLIKDERIPAFLRH